VKYKKRLNTKQRSERSKIRRIIGLEIENLENKKKQKKNLKKINLTTTIFNRKSIS
jgi:hypothetical protein